MNTPLHNAYPESFCGERPTLRPKQVTLEDLEKASPEQPLLCRRQFKKGPSSEILEIVGVRSSVFGKAFVLKGERPNPFPAEMVYLADTGIIPYQAGYWNKYNWLERL